MSGSIDEGAITATVPARTAPESSAARRTISSCTCAATTGTNVGDTPLERTDRGAWA
jgi:hypothetical protein